MGMRKGEADRPRSRIHRAARNVGSTGREWQADLDRHAYCELLHLLVEEGPEALLSYSRGKGFRLLDLREAGAQCKQSSSASRYDARRFPDCLVCAGIRGDLERISVGKNVSRRVCVARQVSRKGGREGRGLTRLDEPPDLRFAGRFQYESSR